MKEHVRRQLADLSDEGRRLIEIELAWEQHVSCYRGGLAISGQARSAQMQRLGGAQNWRCCHCGVRTNEASHPDDMPTREHIVPRALGGTDAESNLAMACRRCNNARGHELVWVPPKDHR